MIVALAGGVGASKFLRGLVRAMPPEELTIVVNTGDDIELWGLHVSPDIDTITYSLGGGSDDERGWGLSGETWACRDAVDRYGMPVWFALGDRDLATHLYRTERLRGGASLTEVTAEVTAAWGITATVLPMSEDPVENRVVVEPDAGQGDLDRAELSGSVPSSTIDGEARDVKPQNATLDRAEMSGSVQSSTIEDGGSVEDLHFQQYLVERGAADPVRSVYLRGVEAARPTPAVLDAIAAADAIVLCPSNPVVSIGPILALEGVRPAIDARRAAGVRVVGVSPIIGGAPVRGPADRLMPAVGLDVSCTGVASAYAGLMDTLVIDEVDAAAVPEVEAFGMDAVPAQTLMTSVDVSEALARIVLDLALRPS